MKETSLVASQLFKDPRVAKAKQLLKEALAEHQKTLTHSLLNNQNLESDYQKLIENFSSVRGGTLWYPYLGSGIGHRTLVELLDGSVKYDFISGIGVHFFGHSYLDTVDASVDAALSDILIQGHLQQNEDALKLSEILLQMSKMDHCFLTSSGAMANENALKIAFQARFPAKRILAFERSFNGRTLVLSAITDKPAFRKGLPETLNVDYLPFFNPEDAEGSKQKALGSLEASLRRYPKDHAVLIFEPVQGEAGFYPGNHAFFKAIFERLKKENILILSDEIQTFGRLESAFGYQTFQLEEYVDIATIGKLSLVAATLFKDNITPQLGLLSQTFTAATSLIKASIILMKKLISDGFFGKEGKNNHIFKLFQNQLLKLEQKYPGKIKGPYGLGGMIAFTPLDGSREKALKFTHDLFKAGVISFIAGDNPTRVRFLPPVGVITEKEIEEAFKIIDQTLAAS